MTGRRARTEHDADATTLEDALEALQAGEPVLVHDAADREGETDLIYPAGAVTPDAVARMRNDAGGLVCVALSDEVASAFDLPFYEEAVDHPAAGGHELGYDDRASFSLTVNHRDTYTGITDADRSLTITALAEAATAPEETDFADEFRVPGHVHLLRAAPDLLAQREGHTELGLALAAAADLPPAVVVCEMLDDETGGELTPADARAYADRHDLVYLEGSEIGGRLD
ncbi:3,4-dihydroxy-2-butanone-4-phosphate synthase [Halobacteria archaeon AArc-m2/3/4]|uniref:3,4-dihydroxy-2-butanone 4-phosphate synthase n=1 Tax=Natronoglomus mannanivorans TaxID=2979990 RepID=A0AAP2YUP4_9EURY|nr:3,4-dihydroxy-2-butanone-4-phosphate synthase [Halobacteria archaeon AArc-xg1-1]MCU4973024.1 3,4-dihydroxy-2-butanone-4-phosphate synthase [Halobacteria archaeon AArc-m2/3/4]